jgi:hypothetical protein
MTFQALIAIAKIGKLSRILKDRRNPAFRLGILKPIQELQTIS